MTQVVKPYLRHPGALDHAVKAAAHHVGRLDRTTDLTGEDEIFIAPHRAERLALSLLALEMRLEDLDNISRERNASPTMLRLWLFEDEALPHLIAE